MDDLDKEYWKKIQGYDYYISTEGRVKNKDGKFLVGSKDTNGYIQSNLTKDKIRTKFRLHRLVAETFIPNFNNLPQVNHKNQNKLDNRMSNLEWVSNLENSQSKNRTTNKGSITSYISNNKIYYKAKINIYGRSYTFSRADKDKCIEWLEEKIKIL